jgi:RHS repeat-associated protein
MDMPGRQYNAATGFRYGFNGKEKDNKDGVVQYDYGIRIYDPRLVRFKSVDPLSGSCPYFTPYQFASNNPIVNIDLDGLEGKCVITDQFKEAFIKDRSIANDDHVKYAVSQGQTVIMHLTYAKGPDDMDTKKIVLFDGGIGADIMSFTAQTNGTDASRTNFFTQPGPQLIRVNGDVSPLSIEKPSTRGILPPFGRLPELSTGASERKGIRVNAVEPVFGKSQGVIPSKSPLSNMDFQNKAPEFENRGSALASISGYLSSLPPGTLSVTINISVEASKTQVIKTGFIDSYMADELMADRINMVSDLVKGSKFPITFNPQYTPGVKQTMSATAQINTTISTVTPIGFNVTRQPVKQALKGGKPSGPILNNSTTEKLKQRFNPVAPRQRVL